MELQVLFSGVPYTGTLPQGEAVLVTQDSRRACPGAVFVCARGMTTDGHDHARKALEAGAVCIVTERPLGLPGEVQVASGRKAYAQLCQNFFGRPAEKLRLVAVTGTNGKTTVTTLIKQTLEQAGCKAGLIGTIHTEIDAMDVPAKYTTPEPWDLNALFSRMVLAGCTFAVMEASSQALDQLRLWGLTFEVGVFTNLTQDHLDYHKTFENYFAAKKSLFSQVKHMVVNLDDSYGRRLLDEVRFTVIRGNISEVKTLASGAGTTKGVDADVADRVTEENLDGAVAFAKAFAAKTGAVVAITGAIDIVADGAKAYCIRNGHPMMSAITGTGCQLSALTAAFITANPGQPLEAAAAAVCAMGLAGEIAHARLTPLDGNATYRNYIIDAIYHMTPAQLEEGAKYEVR